MVRRVPAGTLRDVNYLKRLLAYVLSFRKKDWSLRDYPIRVRRQRIESGSEAAPPKWLAQIPGWWTMTGIGDTREEALRELERSIDGHRERKGALPRPGTEVPVEFAPSDLVSKNDDLAREFFPPIVGMSYDDCLITDESSVWDFPVELTANDLGRKVLLVFGTEIGDLAEAGNIAAILERIAAHRRGEAQ